MYKTESNQPLYAPKFEGNKIGITHILDFKFGIKILILTLNFNNTLDN